jgi:hypothetical protein
LAGPKKCNLVDINSILNLEKLEKIEGKLDTLISEFQCFQVTLADRLARGDEKIKNNNNEINNIAEECRFCKKDMDKKIERGISANRWLLIAGFTFVSLLIAYLQTHCNINIDKPHEKTNIEYRVSK